MWGKGRKGGVFSFSYICSIEKVMGKKTSVEFFAEILIFRFSEFKSGYRIACLVSVQCFPTQTSELNLIRFDMRAYLVISWDISFSNNSKFGGTCYLDKIFIKLALMIMIKFCHM